MEQTLVPSAAFDINLNDVQRSLQECPFPPVVGGIRGSMRLVRSTGANANLPSRSFNLKVEVMLFRQVALILAVLHRATRVNMVRDGHRF